MNNFMERERMDTSQMSSQVAQNRSFILSLPCKSLGGENKLLYWFLQIISIPSSSPINNPLLHFLGLLLMI